MSFDKFVHEICNNYEMYIDKITKLTESDFLILTHGLQYRGENSPLNFCYFKIIGTVKIYDIINNCGWKSDDGIEVLSLEKNDKNSYRICDIDLSIDFDITDCTITTLTQSEYENEIKKI
ncbi:MAG: hypothetical protein J6C23_06950 [Clostridia bacterium]|nr:hypothetical protein [Clostridia bacterium]